MKNARSVLVFVSLIICCILGMPFAVSGLRPQAPPQSSIESRRQQLLSLFDEEWEYELRSDPEYATALGDKRYNDRLSDHSPEFHKSELEQARKFLTRFEAIDPAGFSQQDALSLTLMIRKLREEIEGAQFKPWEMPVNQMGGPHLELAGPGEPDAVQHNR